jgi:fructosamine-3-kinase
VQLPDRSVWRPLAGGSICSVWRVRVPGAGDVVVKETPYPAQMEADGLRALAAAGAPVPEVLDVSDERLVLELVAGTADWAGLGRALAHVHRTTADAFGWPTENRIGSLPQRNDWERSWPSFYSEQRIRPHLDAPALPSDVRRRIARALDGPLHELLPSAPPASLVHGDLWSGNVVSGRWLIDPAVHHADREYELAFADVFGGLPEAFWRAYEKTWPLPRGWQERRPALQLHHLLVHVRLFGTGYVSAVVSRLDALGW